jgi:hypothetical protein
MRSVRSALLILGALLIVVAMLAVYVGYRAGEADGFRRGKEEGVRLASKARRMEACAQDAGGGAQ